MAVAVASVVPFPCIDPPAEYRAPLAFSSFPAPPVRARKDSGVMVAPAAYSVHRTSSLTAKELNAMAKPGGDESTKDEELMKDAKSDVASSIPSKKRATRDDEDAEELDVTEEREAKKRRVASGFSLVDLKINIVVPPTEPKPAPVVEFEPTVVDDGYTADLDRQIEEIEKQIAVAMQKLEAAPCVLPPSPTPSTVSMPIVVPEHKPARPSPLKSFTVTKPGMSISQFSKVASGGPSAPRVSSPAPSAIVPPSLPAPVVERPVSSGKATGATAGTPSTPTSSLRRSRRLSSLPPIDTKPRRSSPPPPRDSLYRQALINQMRIASMADDFGSPKYSPPTAPTMLPSVTDEDVDMERVDTDSVAKTPLQEPVDPRLFPRQGCLRRMKAEHERRRVEQNFDCEVVWFAAKLQFEMGIGKRGGGRRRRGC